MEDSLDTTQVIEDVHSFNKFFDSHYEWACAVAMAFVHDIHAAEDIVADAFVVIWKHRAKINPVRPYFLKVIRNKCLNYIRYLKAQEALKDAVEQQMLERQENFILESEHPFTYVEQSEMKRIINEAIEKLPPKCRQIFVMNHYEEKSYKEIAEELNITENTIKTQMKIAFKKLREMLKDKFIMIFFLF